MSLFGRGFDKATLAFVAILVAFAVIVPLLNLALPPYKFVSDTTIRIGETAPAKA